MNLDQKALTTAASILGTPSAHLDTVSRIIAAYLSSLPSTPAVTEEREVLFFASYCGDDNPACSRAKPCPTCLGMSNVYSIPAGTVIRYSRELAPEWNHDEAALSSWVEAQATEYGEFTPISVRSDTAHPAPAVTEELEEALRLASGRLFDANEPMADGDVRMTAAEEVLCWLLVEKIGVPDDRSYSPNEAQEILVRALAHPAPADAVEPTGIIRRCVFPHCSCDVHCDTPADNARAVLSVGEE